MMLPSRDDLILQFSGAAALAIGVFVWFALEDAVPRWFAILTAVLVGQLVLLAFVQRRFDDLA